MLSGHSHIEQPTPETIIWRYIDLERFISLLHTRLLYLCRLDAFRDPWEGSWPKPLVEALKANWTDGQGDQFIEISNKLRTANYVSCWHASQSESAALWDLYSGKSGVAIQSTVGALIGSISDEKKYYIGTVKYIDFDTEHISDLNFLVPPFLKRKSFEHEREVRVLYWHPPNVSSGVQPTIAAENYALSIDPNVLIEKLYIAPSSPSWLTQAMQDLCLRFGLSATVTRSSLYDPRVY
jgi:hypothetical protein